MLELLNSKFPNSLDDVSLGGTKIEDGMYSLLSQIENRINNTKQPSLLMLMQPHISERKNLWHTAAYNGIRLIYSPQMK